MKKLVYILGGQASGKMTIGEELSKITGLKLFHNHMTVELASHFYGFGVGLTPEQKAQHKELFADIRDGIRHLVFKNIARSYLEGMIFTGVMYFDEEEDYKIFNGYYDAFMSSAKQAGEQVEFVVVELICSVEERQRRNLTANRLEKKPSKRNTEWTTKEIADTVKTHRFESTQEDRKRFNADKYLIIDNTKLSASEVAVKIKKELGI